MDEPIQFMLFINIEHDIKFGNDASRTRALGIKIVCNCLNNEVKQIYK